MPYVYIDELSDGMEAADVISGADYTALQEELTNTVSAKDELQQQYDDILCERDKLQIELSDAKTKFANAFLSSPQKLNRKDPEGDTKKEPMIEPKTFSSLFAERNKNAY